MLTSSFLLTPVPEVTVAHPMPERGVFEEMGERARLLLGRTLSGGHEYFIGEVNSPLPGAEHAIGLLPRRDEGREHFIRLLPQRGDRPAGAQNAHPHVLLPGE